MTGINFAVGLYTKESYYPTKIDSYGYLELKWTRHEWEWKKIEGSSRSKFYSKKIPKSTHSCYPNEITEKFYPAPDQQANNYFTRASRNMTCADDLNQMKIQS